MLKIAKSVEYALFSLKYINESNGNDAVSVKEISDNVDIPYDLLAKILQKLARNNFVESRKGKQGGYIISADLTKSSLYELILSVDENIQFTNCMVENPTKQDCGRIDNCCLKDPMNKIQRKLVILFDEIKINELI